jgi:hypothetical protein
VEPTDYKPRHNTYKPLRDLEQKNQDAPDKAGPAVEAQREQEPGRDSRIPRPSINMQGGPMGGLESVNSYGNQQVKYAQQKAQEQTTSKERTPAEDRVKQSAERRHEAPDPSIARTKSNEIER